ncbi:MAG: hypothetical protein HY360_11375 [Verrucomicrobia bacterium]|nr:hypothetical protein [Verrucomicrobiota bacterium]
MNRLLSFLALFLGMTFSLRAVQTEKFVNDSFADFSEGEAHGAAIVTDGFLRIGPEVRKWASLSEAVVWAAVRDSKGALFVAAGNEGQIFKVKADAKPVEFFKAAELQIQALAFDKAGDLYAASMPDGKVYRFHADGKSSVFFDPKEKYIWALQFDPDGNLFVATGDKGRLYKVSRNGKGAVFYDSDETHIRTLLLDDQNRLWAGSEGNGLVYRFDKTDGATATPFVVYDSQYREIKALALAPKGAVFVAAMGDGKTSSIQMPTRAKPTAANTAVPETPAAIAAGTAGGASGPKVEETSYVSSGADKPGAGEVVQFFPDGSAEKWWSDSEDVYALAVVENGRVWAGTGKKGKLLELLGPKQFSILGQLEAETITCLLPNGKEGWLAATSNDGALWTLLLSPGRKGTFESKTFDARATARWGILDSKIATGSGKVAFLTRSGNTAKPDKTWSDWIAVDQDHRVKSPLARFLQYKVALEAGVRSVSSAPFVDSVTLYYQTKNQSPKINRITVFPSNVELVKMPKMDMPLPPINPSFGSVAPARGFKPAGSDGGEDPYAAMARTPILQQVKKLGSRSLSWQAGDPNGDELRYDVLYRAAGTAEWKPLGRDIRDQFFSWDAATWPDGEYYAKVIATDLPSNREDEARTDEWTSDAFTVDNTAPTIEVDASVEAVKKEALTVVIRDTTSIVDEAEFSLDGEPWRPLLPVGGIYDARNNTFAIPVAKLQAGQHHVVIRASDSANNVATQTARFRK